MPKKVPELATALILVLHGCASSPQVEDAEVQQQVERAAVALAMSSNPDALAAAAVLRAKSHAAGDLALLARATAIAPERPDLAWLHAQFCAGVTECDPAPLELRMRTLDPNNGAAWMATLTRAGEANDDDELDRALQELARTEKVDIYWTTLVARLSHAAVDCAEIGLPSVLVEVTGGVAQVGIPTYAAVSNACKGARLDRTDVVSWCRKVATAMMRGDTFITEMIGIVIAKRVWPPDSEEVKAAMEARRVYRYRSNLWHERDRFEWNEQEAEHYVQLLSEHRREQDVLLAQIVEAGEDANPPPDWTDDAH